MRSGGGWSQRGELAMPLLITYRHWTNVIDGKMRHTTPAILLS